MRVVSFKVEEELLRMLEDYARRRGMPKSEVIRRALRRYLEQSDLNPVATGRIRVYA
ncbi:MAG: ribbon-helix-helix protein, CopG family [Desulfurococcales archaeon]|nr:ribbon-helix-helix protein, CopG family [Desulfurococcales archaeon]